ncbi:MAG: CPBP family intramembrane glutamic endopeptidase [Bacteroidota bacterium]
MDRKKRLISITVILLLFLFPKLKYFGLVLPNILICALIEIALLLIAMPIISKGSFTLFGFRGFRLKLLIYPTIVLFLFAFSLNYLDIYILQIPKGSAQINITSKSLRYLYAIVIGPILEELVFRGILQTSIDYLQQKNILKIRNFKISLSVFITALAFSLMHFSNLLVGASLYLTTYIVISAFIVGLVLSYYRERTQSLFPPIILHILYNLLVIIFTIVLIKIRYGIFIL